MTGRIGAATIALAILANPLTPHAQVRQRGDGHNSTASGGGIRGTPSTKSTGSRAEIPPPPIRSTARLRFVPRALDVRQFPFPFCIGLGWSSFGCFPLAYVNDGAPIQGAASIPLPEDAPRGGVQVDVEPRSAQVYVDGAYVGVVSNFSGYFRHLDLVAGSHVITIVAPDYEPLTVQMEVSPGATATYRGTLTRARGR